jgi:hypothetical protein
MTGKKFRRAQAPPALALHRKNPQRSAAAAHDDSIFIRAQNFSGRARFFNRFGLPDFQQVRLRLLAP